MPPGSGSLASPEHLKINFEFVPTRSTTEGVGGLTVPEVEKTQGFSENTDGVASRSVSFQKKDVTTLRLASG